MKKIFIIPSLLMAVQVINAQVPEEALRLSWRTQTGTARNQAIGGAMGSLGGEATANIVNPAGLAFFKTSDFVLTPALQFGKEKNSFRGTPFSASNKSSMPLGTSGWVFGGFGQNAKSSFALTVTKVANFNQFVNYNGQNNTTSFATPLADEFAGSRLNIDQALNSDNISLPTKMALYTYLVDTAAGQVIARSEGTTMLNQQHKSEINGGITEITLGMGHEVNKKLMLGASLGIPIVKVDRSTYYRESDATDVLNEFKYMAFHENYSLRGVGLNLRAGFIYRPQDYLRFGLAFHSPDMLMLRENYNSGMATDVENRFVNSYDSVASKEFTNGNDIQSKYTTYTPTRIILSGSYVFREVEDVTKQKGFITADIEYVNYKWMKFGTSDEESDFSKEYYKPFNEAIDAYYKGAFNFRLGGELKFNTIMARLGFSYYGNPYKDNSDLKASKMNLSGGLGYRHKGVFVDLTYVHRLNKDVNFPYRVSAPNANTFAELKETNGNVLLTIGFKI